MEDGRVTHAAPVAVTPVTVAPRALPYDAVPLRFVLVRPLSGSTSPCAALVATVALRSTCHSSASRSVEDLTQQVDQPSIEIVRILDPEPREPFVSLARIFLSCGVTPVEGLLRFKLERPEFDCTLGGIAPFYDIWVPLRTARRVAQELGILDELAGLLELETRKAWTVEDKEEGGIVHNWKIASDRIAPQEYSTQKMLSVTFPRIHLLPSGSQVRTLLPSSTNSDSYSPMEPIRSPSHPTYNALWSKLVEWSVSEYDRWLELANPDNPQSESSPAPLTQPAIPAGARRKEPEQMHEPSLTPLFLFSTIFPLLDLSGSLPRSTSPATPAPLPAAIDYLSGVVLARSELVPGSLSSRDEDETETKTTKGKLYLADAISRFALATFAAQGKPATTGETVPRTRDQTRGQEGHAVEVAHARASEKGNPSEWRNEVEGRLSVLERKLVEEVEEEEEDKVAVRIERRVCESWKVELAELRQKVEKLEQEGKRRDMNQDATCDTGLDGSGDTSEGRASGQGGGVKGVSERKERRGRTWIREVVDAAGHASICLVLLFLLHNGFPRSWL